MKPPQANVEWAIERSLLSLSLLLPLSLSLSLCMSLSVSLPSPLYSPLLSHPPPQPSTRKAAVLQQIVAELKLDDADCDGDGKVSFEEFCDAFKRRVLMEKIALPPTSATYMQYFQELTKQLNVRLVQLVQAMATELART